MRDRALSLPTAWPHNATRGQGAGLPAARRLAPTPQRAQQMRQRALAPGVPAAGVPGDRVSGAHRARRWWGEAYRPAHVVAVSGPAYVWRAGRPQQVQTILAALAAEGGGRVRAGAGAKGPRWSDWPWRALAAPRQPPWRRGLWVRWRLRAPTELPASVGCAPPVTVRATGVQGAGRRWTLERCFAEAQGEVGREQ